MLKKWFHFGLERIASKVTSTEHPILPPKQEPDAIHDTGFFLLRQPIIDAGNHIIGYDLGFRSVDAMPGQDAVLTQLDKPILSKFAALGLAEACVGKELFIRVSGSLLSHRDLALLPKQQVVLAIDMNQADAIEYVHTSGRALAAEGWKLVLDNLPDLPQADALLDIPAYLRFDLRLYNAVELNQRIKALRGQRKLTIIARQVETEDEYEASQMMTFDAYQGYYFIRVLIDRPRRVDHDRIRVIRMLNMAAQHAEIIELDLVIKRDPILAYKLLAYINSPLSGLDHQLESIAQALMFLGYEPLYRWLTALLFTTGVRGPRDRLLLQQALVRARLMELLALRCMSHKEADLLFIVGMFSLLDALLNQPMAQAIEPLNLTEQVKTALLTGDGPLATIMHLGIALEGAQWYKADELARSLGLNADQVNPLLVEAMTWVMVLDNLPHD